MILAIRFSGIPNQETLDQKTQKLQQYAQTNGLQLVGEPSYAFYNPPWTLPWMRRNEVLWQIKTSSK